MSGCKKEGRKEGRMEGKEGMTERKKEGRKEGRRDGAAQHGHEWPTHILVSCDGSRHQER